MLARGEVRVGVDVGGTFTDFVIFYVEEGRVERLKIPSTPQDPAKAVIEGLRRIVEKVGHEKMSVVVHASTIGSNLFLGQLGLEIPKTALVTTKGFRDVLEIGRQRRPELYNVFFTKPRPLVPRRLRFTVTERVSHRGEVLTPLNEEEVVEIAKRLREEGVKAVAICLLNSYVNPVHERKVAEILRELLPQDVYIVPSCEVDPEYREYERTSTTVVNTVLMPVISQYILNMKRGLEALGVRSNLLIMLSSGGVVSADKVIKAPAATIESGPAAGVVASTYISRMLSVSKALSFDMGGTTAKVCAIVGGEPLVVPEFEVGGRVHRGRLIRGSGYVVRYPHIDLAEVSAGGGTIAWVDEAGRLRVGPYSAGSDPGPACYGRGGTDPTVTDANLVLGRLGRVLAGGEVVLREDLARRAIEEKICAKTGLSLEEAAHGVIRLVNAEMARAIKIVTVERGLDPREFTLIAFGGAGPMHACDLAEELRINNIIVPQAPGTFSALGLLLADYRYDLKTCILKRLGELDADYLEDCFRELEERGERLLREEGFTEENMVFLRYVDMRYARQSYELMIPAPRPVTDMDSLRLRFLERHRELYGYAVETEDVILVNVRVTAIGVTRKPSLREHTETGTGGPEPYTYREVYFDSEGWVKTPIYKRESLKAGQVVYGPAIVEDYDSTIVIKPGWTCRADKYLNLLIEKR